MSNWLAEGADEQQTRERTSSRIQRIPVSTTYHDVACFTTRMKEEEHFPLRCSSAHTHNHGEDEREKGKRAGFLHLAPVARHHASAEIF